MTWSSIPFVVVALPWLLRNSFIATVSALTRPLRRLNWSRQRVQIPIRSESKLLESGREAYKNLPDNVVQVLRELPVKLVQAQQWHRRHSQLLCWWKTCCVACTKIGRRFNGSGEEAATSRKKKGCRNAFVDQNGTRQKTARVFGRFSCRCSCYRLARSISSVKC